MTKNATTGTAQGAGTGPSRRRKLLFGLIAATLGVTFTLLVVEIAVRLLVPWGDYPRWFVQDQRYGYFHHPNWKETYRYAHTNVSWEVRFNSLGLRDQEYDFARPGAFRILLLGDSFTFGYGLEVEDLFDTKLESKLRESGMDADVINAGVGGWGTLQEFQFARDHWEQLKPDVIVLTFCDNDHVDNEAFQRGITGGFLPEFPGKAFLRRHSRLYVIVYTALHDFLHQFLVAKREEPAAAQAPSPPKETLPQELVGTRETLEATPEVWLQAKQIIHDFSLEFRAFNPDGVLIIQAAQPWRPDMKGHLGMLANGDSIVYLDLFPDGVDWKPEDAYLPYDPHWDAEMHSYVAERLFELIRRLRSSRS